MSKIIFKHYHPRAQKYFSTTTLTHATLLKDTLASLGFEQNGLNQAIPGVFDGEKWAANGEEVESVNPATNEVLAKVRLGNKEDAHRCISNIYAAKKEWAATPAPKRGEVVRKLGMALREKITPLSVLLSMEMGKILSESRGEVQEYIDVCDLAVGLSRTFAGKMFPSERPEHSLIEVWNPLGTCGIITAFNFPIAVAGWNSAISLVCGNTQIVKGSETTSLVNIAVQKIVIDVLKESNISTKVATLCQGLGTEVGEVLSNDPRLDLISFTGSTKVGKRIQQVVGDRFGKALLELGGNNAMIIQDSTANLENGIQNALNSVLFAAVGTCGQRCTSLRRLLVHEKIYDEFVPKLTKLYESVIDPNNHRIGDPLKTTTLVGPLHRKTGVKLFEDKISEIKRNNGRVLVGGKTLQLPGNFVTPVLVEVPQAVMKTYPHIKEENFLPILHVIKYKTLEEAIGINNSSEHGLSSSLFTSRHEDVFTWMSASGSDCGIVNVNTSCSGAEIGGAFGGNKATGWGRESGSDSWKQYMRRSTCAVNYGKSVPLAQGITFA